MAIVCVYFAMDTELERIWSDLKLTEEEKEMIVAREQKGKMKERVGWLGNYLRIGHSTKMLCWVH